MKTLCRSLVILGLCFFAPRLHAQELPGVKVSNDDPRWGEKISVTYTAAAGSAWASPECADTMYCAAMVRGAHLEHAIIQQMRHVSGPTYQTELTVPDSTHSLWVEIDIPSDRLPNGITVFTCRTRDGKPTSGAVLETSTNIDSALAVDLALYPKDYTAYLKAYDKIQELRQSGAITMSDSLRKVTIISYMDRLLAHPDNTAAWHLALASIYARRGRDSLSRISLENAAKSQGFDPLFNDAEFWSSFFAPTMTKSGLEFPMIPGRILAPLVERNPRTVLAANWIRHMAFDTLLPASSFRKVTDAWAASHDVDVLQSIGQAYGFPKGPLYDPKTALVWYTRAEESARTLSGFYSGDNIWSGMGRLGHILSGKAAMLAALGRSDEAITLARTAMTQAKQPYVKKEIAAVLAKAYLDAGRIEDAKRAFGMALSSSNINSMEGLDLLYAKAKQGDETQPDFAKRLIDTYSHDVDLPPVPDFTFTTLDGMKGSLSGLRGKVVVLDCWFTSCAGCVIEKPSLNKLVEAFAGDTNVVFLSVALNDAKTVNHFLEHTPSKFKIVPDGEEICSKIGVQGYPTHIVIGRNGKTLGFDEGGSENEGEMMKPKIVRALAAK